MIKRIKNFFRVRKEKKMRRIKMQIEVLETLASICLYLDYEGHYSRNRFHEYIRMHYSELKNYSKDLKDDIWKKARW